MVTSPADSVTLPRLDLSLPESRHGESALIYRLPGGRRLAYEEYGLASGKPVVYFHDAGSSRLEGALFHDQAQRRGLRLIAVDRPGVGQSDFAPVAQPLDFCRDVLRLADHLGIERFALLSFAGGGIYALSLCRYFPRRVWLHLSLGGIPGSVFNEGGERSAVASCLGGLTPPVMKFLVRLKYSFFPEEPQQNIARLKSHLSYTDRKLLQDAAFTRRLVRDQQEALRRGCRGVAQDIALGFRKLEFRLREVGVPTAIWLGGADLLTQRGDCEFLVSRLPQARLYRAANLGHFFFVHRMDQVFASFMHAGTALPGQPLAA